MGFIGAKVHTDHIFFKFCVESFKDTTTCSSTYFRYYMPNYEVTGEITSIMEHSITVGAQGNFV